jgi:hypothetical protein
MRAVGVQDALDEAAVVVVAVHQAVEVAGDVGVGAAELVGGGQTRVVTLELGVSVVGAQQPVVLEAAVSCLKAW